METSENFENILFNPFCKQEKILLNNNLDPDNNFSEEKIFLNINAQYFSVEETKANIKDFTSENFFSILHVNIRSMSKNFQKLKLMLHECDHNFSIICLTETWCSDESFRNNSNLILPNYDSIHLGRKDKRGGGICVFISKELSFKQRKEFSISDENSELISIEIINKRCKNIIVNTCYRPPNAKITPFKIHITSIFQRLSKENKKVFFIGDFNMNSLDYTTNDKVRKFIDLMFSNGMLSVINRPTRISQNKFSCIDHIYTNSVINSNTISGIVKTDISDHFPIFIIEQGVNITTYPDKIEKQARLINDKNLTKFKNTLNERDWAMLLNMHDPNTAYDIFTKQFLKLYESCFPLKKIVVKRKNLLSPWITAGIMKSSKQKQKLYVKFLKHRTFTNEKNYKNYKQLFEKVKLKSRIQYYSSQFKKYQDNAKETWRIMKEITGKIKVLDDTFPHKIIINNKEISDEKIIADEFNSYFINVGTNLAAKIPHSGKHFSDYLSESRHILSEEQLTINEFREAFQSIKRNKACGFDEISPNVVKSSYEELVIPLFHICKLSLQSGCFPNQMKIAKVKPLFKTGEHEILSNYRPISILPTFSKLLERIMYNRVYKHVTQTNLLYDKQFGFQKQCSTEHAILQLSKEILSSFNKTEFTLGVFVDLSKAFDTVNHDILLAKLRHLGIDGTYLKWFKSYLCDRKQYVTYGQNKQSSVLTVNCGVPQGSILGPLLFLLYVNDLCKASRVLEPIMFADDTNLFFSHSNIKELFNVMNHELNNIQLWFNANKLSLNVAKTKYSFFHSLSHQDRIPLHLPKLKINHQSIKRETAIQFLGVLLDENLTWRSHISCIENKISKNLGILYKAREIVNKKCMKQLYFSFIHSYLSYGCIAWASTNKTKLKTLHRRQKHGSRIINFKDKFTHAEPLMQELNALNIFQLNVYQTLLFMHKVKHLNIPKVFEDDFTVNRNKYNTKAANTTFYKPQYNTKMCQFSIRYRGPHIWNSLMKDEGELQELPYNSFKEKIKKCCLFLSDFERFF